MGNLFGCVPEEEVRQERQRQLALVEEQTARERQAARTARVETIIQEWLPGAVDTMIRNQAGFDSSSPLSFSCDMERIVIQAVTSCLRTPNSLISEHEAS